jgi:hypothetical protein
MVKLLVASLLVTALIAVATARSLHDEAPRPAGISTAGSASTAPQVGEQIHR